MRLAGLPGNTEMHVLLNVGCPPSSDHNHSLHRCVRVLRASLFPVSQLRLIPYFLFLPLSFLPSQQLPALQPRIFILNRLLQKVDSPDCLKLYLWLEQISVVQRREGLQMLGITKQMFLREQSTCEQPGLFALGYN